MQGIGAGKEVRAALEPVISGTRATALALVFSELLQNALEHGGETVRAELSRRNGDVVLAIAGRRERNRGRDRLGHRPLDRPRARSGRVAGITALESKGSGMRAEVVFPA